MSNNPQDQRFKKWLDILQQESWQLELIISGFAIYGLFMIIDPMELALQEAKNQNNEYDIINGSTGELFITENDAIETFTYYKNFPKLDELKKGIQQFIQAFEYNGSLYPKLKEEKFFKRRIKQSEIDRMMTENQFFKSTVNGIRFFEIK